jgi:hypothetical protein
MPKFLNHQFVAHVGSMEAARKNAGSHEGAGLSVSVHPIAWARIHRIGDEGFILEGPGRFLDAMRLTKAERAEIWRWAKGEGLVTDAIVWTVSYEDEELEDVVSFECSTEDEAEAEADEIMDAVVSSKLSTVATTKLAELCDHDPDKIGPQHLPTDFQFDLVLLLWAEQNLADVDGVWWNEKLDVASYSAPRGVIFSSRIPTWEARPAGLAELLEFQSGRWASPRSALR